MILLEVAIFSFFAFWLLGLVPAAVITVFKEQWALFVAGWLTFGVVWFLGAASTARPGSMWANRFPPRDGGRGPVVALCVVGLVFAVGLFAARPSPILGIHGSALQSSVGGGSLFGTGPSSCDRLEEDRWMCSRWDSQMSGQIPYPVRVNGLGCWEGIRTEGAYETYEDSRSACVTVLAYLFD